MNELYNSKTKYYVNIEGNTTTVSSNYRIHVEDSYYDLCSRLWVFAIKVYDSDSSYSPYHIDYLFMDSSYNLVHVIQEKYGFYDKRPLVSQSPREILILRKNDEKTGS